MSLEDDAPDANIPPLISKNMNENKIEAISGRGNHANQATIINYNYNYVIDGFMNGRIEEVYKDKVSIKKDDDEEEYYSDDAASDSNDALTTSGDEFIEEIKTSSNDTTFVNTPRATTRADAGELPRTNAEIETWYYQELNERERCIVNACAVLHGATLRAIAEATRELSSSLNQTFTIHTQVTPSSATELNSLSASTPDSLMWVYLLSQQEERIRAMHITTDTADGIASPPFSNNSPSGSINRLLESTYTYTSRVNGAIRVFWQDTDASGLSRFSIDLLSFLAREAATKDIFGSQSVQSFIDIVKQWPARYRGERSWRSASALGIIWWYQDARNLLWRQANKWAKSQQKQDWEHAAALLDGAYQVECYTITSDTDDSVNSSVLQLLDKWTSIAQQSTTKRGEGYAAARAYALIGRKSPEIAIKGLERLLRIPTFSYAVQNGSRDPLEDLFIFAILKYVDIARAGHLRQVLKYLADGAKLHIDAQKFSRTRRERGGNTQQNSTSLHTILTAFFLLTSCSLSAVDAHMTPTYSVTEQLPEYPSCPDNAGRDILLAGLLTTAEPRWQDQLATLLCSVIMDKNYPAALYLMRRWGEIVLQDQSTDAATLQGTYAKFLVKVGKMLLELPADQGKARLGAYRRQLTLWLTDRRLSQPHFKGLAQKVLDQLPKTI